MFSNHREENQVHWMLSSLTFTDHLCTIPLGEKRKLGTDAQGPAATKSKQDLLSDLIVLGIPYSATQDELKSYFEKFGDLDHCQVITFCCYQKQFFRPSLSPRFIDVFKWL